MKLFSHGKLKNQKEGPPSRLDLELLTEEVSILTMFGFFMPRQSRLRLVDFAVKMALVLIRFFFRHSVH